MSPVQERGEVIAVQQVGAYAQFTVRAPGIAAGFRPGHFVAVAVGGANSPMLLRRAFALYGASQPDGTVQFVVAERGAGTKWLLQRPDYLDVVGPLGTPFAMPSTPEAAVLVGGGYGTAPLIPLATALLGAGSPVEIVLGASTAQRLFGEHVAARLGVGVTVTTDDGSAGQAGRVTDAVPGAIDRLAAKVVYACGPMPMLRAIGDLARARGIRSQVAVEEAMACGIGVCMTCVLPVRGDDGRTRLVRSCVDGPVFDADRVRWDDIGRLAADLVGADAMGGR